MKVSAVALAVGLAMSSPSPTSTITGWPILPEHPDPLSSCLNIQVILDPAGSGTATVAIPYNPAYPNTLVDTVKRAETQRILADITIDENHPCEGIPVVTSVTMHPNTNEKEPKQ